MTSIAREMPEHFAAVRQLTIDAFAASEFGHHGEADLIDAIRDQCDESVSLVAIDDNCVVGNILFSPAAILSKSSTIHGMGLGPMAVLPSHQNCGVGSMLVREGLRHVAQTAASFSLVAGHPDFYSRFGFLPAQRFSVTHGFEGMPQDILLIHLPDKSLVPGLVDGLAYFHKIFGPQHIG